MAAPWQQAPAAAALSQAPPPFSLPTASDHRKKRLRIVIPLAAAGVAVAAGLVVVPMLSGPELTPGRTVSPVPAGTPVSSAEELLSIAEDTGAENCEIPDVVPQG